MDAKDNRVESMQQDKAAVSSLKACFSCHIVGTTLGILTWGWEIPEDLWVEPEKGGV